MLVTLNGEYVIVEWVQHEILEAPITVYNFEVEDFHTYYVGDDDGILVHMSKAISLYTVQGITKVSAATLGPTILGNTIGW